MHANKYDTQVYYLAVDEIPEAFAEYFETKVKDITETCAVDEKCFDSLCLLD